MLLSILTPLYRSASTLERCLDSISASASQAAIRLESVLVFDGPDPAAAEMLRHRPVDDLVTVVVREQQHQGIASARNTALEAASGSHVTLLDADDELTAERLLAAARSGTETVLIGRQRVIAVSDAGIPGVTFVGEVPSEPHHLASLVAPREWLMEIDGFDDSYRLGDDWDLMIRLREAGRPIEYCDDVFVRRHITGHNASLDTQGLSSDFLAGIRSHRKRMSVQLRSE